MVRPQCPTCPAYVGQRHTPWCRLVRLAGPSRSPYVGDLDTERAACGCSGVMVARLGRPGHRADCGRPSAPRPPAAVPPAALPAGGLLIWSAVHWLLDLDAAAGSVGGGWTSAAAIALAVLPAAACVLAVVLLVRSYRPATWPGRRVIDGGEPGRLVRCWQCGGGGLLFEQAYADESGQPQPADGEPGRLA